MTPKVRRKRCSRKLSWLPMWVSGDTSRCLTSKSLAVRVRLLLTLRPFTRLLVSAELLGNTGSVSALGD